MRFRILLVLLLAGSLALGVALSVFAGDAPSISPEALLESLKKQQDRVLVLDVRSEEEFAKGHVPGAVHIPYDELESRVDEVKAREADRIVVYCERGGRAGKAEATLQDAGFENVYDLEGHMKAWRADRRPTKRPLSSVDPKADP